MKRQGSGSSATALETQPEPEPEPEDALIPPCPWPVGARVAKRALDVALSSLGLAVTFGPLVAFGLAVRATSRGPALFYQERMGRGGRPFRIYKLRTMVVAGVAARTTGAATRGLLITARNDPRVTRLGRFLRRSKIDELPQLWNVLRGDMSLVGPRPEVPLYRHHYRGERALVLSVRPGITDPASVAFRDEEDLLAGYVDRERAYRDVVLPRKLTLSERYVREQSFAGDLAILFRTALAVTGLA